MNLGIGFAFLLRRGGLAFSRVPDLPARVVGFADTGPVDSRGWSPFEFSAVGGVE